MNGSFNCHFSPGFFIYKKKWCPYIHEYLNLGLMGLCHALDLSVHRMDKSGFSNLEGLIFGLASINNGAICKVRD